MWDQNAFFSEDHDFIRVIETLNRVIQLEEKRKLILRRYWGMPEWAPLAVKRNFQKINHFGVRRDLGQLKVRLENCGNDIYRARAFLRSYEYLKFCLEQLEYLMDSHIGLYQIYRLDPPPNIPNARIFRPETRINVGLKLGI